METKSEYKSPIKYKPKRLIKEIIYSTKEPMEYYLGSVLFIQPDENDYGYYIDEEFRKILEKKFVIYKIPEINTINIDVNKEFKNFLCDLEVFNWEKKPYTKMISDMLITRDDIYQNYQIYLIKSLGDDITLYGNAFSDNFVDSKIFLNAMVDQPIVKLLNYDENLIHRSFSIHITELEDNKFYGNFSKQILRENATTRYAIINLIIEYKSGSHYTFLFIDHKEKSIDFYNPHGGINTVYLNSFIYGALIQMFSGYSIDEFWNHKGLQTIENIEEDEFGFCVIWGHIMMHLKLLNINMSLGKIETAFLKDCYDKEISPYEVMLNYAYFMSRIVSLESKKFNKLETILKEV